MYVIYTGMGMPAGMGSPNISIWMHLLSISHFPIESGHRNPPGGLYTGQMLEAAILSFAPVDH